MPFRNLQVTADLISMGYRPMNPEGTIYGKPIGGELIKVNLEEGEISSHFRRADDGTPWLYEVVKFNRSNVNELDTEFLIGVENGFIGRFRGRSEAGFAFISQDEKAKILVDSL